MVGRISGGTDEGPVQSGVRAESRPADDWKMQAKRKTCLER